MAEPAETAKPLGRASQPDAQPQTSTFAPVDRLVEVIDALPGGSVILTTVEQMLNWGRASSLWPSPSAWPAVPSR
jgi:hypothetical protein